MATLLLSLAIGIVLCLIVGWRGLMAALDKLNDPGWLMLLTLLILISGRGGLFPMFGASGTPPIVENFELNVSGTLSAWDIGDGTILEAWQ